MAYIESEISSCVWPKNDNNFKTCEKDFELSFHSRFKENTWKAHTEIKLDKIGAKLEVYARKSSVHFAQ
jgi:hypothetical protein